MIVLAVSDFVSSRAKPIRNKVSRAQWKPVYRLGLIEPSGDHVGFWRAPFVTTQLERYRSYLLLLARMQLDGRWRAQLDPSDIVQQTLLEARVKWPHCAIDDPRLAAWLRGALANNGADAVRSLKRAKRDVRRETPLAALEASSARLESWLAANQSSPSQRAVKNEDLLRLADAVTQLPEAQREAIVLHHLQGKTLSETAGHLDRSEAATAGLLHRALKRLRELLQETL